MMPVGFASGCFTATDYDTAWDINRRHGGQAFEVGCYRTEWVSRAKAWIADAPPDIPISVHLPRYKAVREAAVAAAFASLDRPLVLHADRIAAPRSWRGLGSAVLVENIAHPAVFGSTAADLDEVFAALPAARFCLDVSHAFGAGGVRAVSELAARFQDRLAQLHVGCTGVPARPMPWPSDAELVHIAGEAAGRPVPVIIERPCADGRAPEVGHLFDAISAVVSLGDR